MLILCYLSVICIGWICAEELMKRQWIIILILTISVTNGYGQEMIYPHDSAQPRGLSQINYFLNNNSEQGPDLTQKIEKLVNRLEKVQKRRNSDQAFLRAIFYKTHNNLLRDYSRLASFEETLADGNFGCVSGTAIYGILLDHFGYDYQIIELPNHVFIHLSLDNESYIFESTLAYNGFRKSDENLENILKQRWINHRNITRLETVGNWFEDFQLEGQPYTTIDLKELAGLQYFNEAAIQYTQKNYKIALELAMEGYQLYDSQRIEKLMQLIINKILRYEQLKQSAKEKYLDQYVKFVKNRKLSQSK